MPDSFCHKMSSILCAFLSQMCQICMFTCIYDLLKKKKYCFYFSTGDNKAINITWVLRDTPCAQEIYNNQHRVSNFSVSWKGLILSILFFFSEFICHNFHHHKICFELISFNLIKFSKLLPMLIFLYLVSWKIIYCDQIHFLTATTSHLHISCIMMCYQTKSI